MPRAFLAFALTLIAASAAAGPVTLKQSTALTWPGSLTLRGEILAQDLRAAAAAQAPIGSAGPGLEQSLGRLIVAGISLPWLRAGPLTASGLLREVANPLGFGAGSGVFVQRSELVLDLSLPGKRPGVFLSPFPRTLAGFYFPAAAEHGERLGLVGGFGDPERARLDCLVSLSKQSADQPGEDWVRSSAAFPGGSILTCAARLTLGSPVLGVTTTIGSSSGELFPTGRFVHVHCFLRTGGVGLYALAAAADPSYLTPSAGHCSDATKLSGAAVYSGATGEARLRLSRTVRQMPYSPASSLAHVDEASLSLERRIVSAETFSLSARGELAREEAEGSDGGQDNTVSWTGALVARASPVRCEASVSATSESPSVNLAAEVVLDRRGSSIGTEAVLETGRKEVLSDISAFFRLKGESFSLTLEAGLEKPCMEGAHFSVLWTFRSTGE